MSPQSAKERLEYLQANLKQIDDSPGLGKSSDVLEIKRRLLRRIADVERIVQLTGSTNQLTVIGIGLP